MTSICYTPCRWYSPIHDEHGIIDYCTRREVYGDEIEEMLECLYFEKDKREERAVREWLVYQQLKKKEEFKQ